MARKKMREYDSKRLLKEHLKRLGGYELSIKSAQIRGVVEEFIKVVFTLFQDLDFTFLEMNPFTLVDGKPYPLDMRGELDDTAVFKNLKKWGKIEFPMPFGRVMSPTETFIHGLDEKTSASLKFTVLNPKGRIWTMVAGGGASVIYAGTVGPFSSPFPLENGMQPLDFLLKLIFIRLVISGVPPSSVTMQSTVGPPTKRKSCSTLELSSMLLPDY
ncbi:hypothetical protein SAY87_018024 [Trapa incisa]|uniref:ATP-citrate synthase citrate-binding domain-containing protein n=1 Tax=Trapa incisa TaxID=236973 RepID=A0AAN7L1Q9_9MYRT|nr:hypothetical protein SAY87_018024 [Trapa incisa]